MKKRIKRLIAAIVLIPVVLVIVLFVYIDAIAKAGVERGATYALGVNTTLDSMSVGVLRGRVAMEGLDVANPPGFNSDRFLRLGEGRVAVTLGSLMENTVVLPELRLTGINVNLEKKGKSANYQVILDGLKKFESEGEPAAPAKEDAKKFIVKLVTVEDVNVQVDLLGIGGGLTQLPIHLDKIELRDVGSESDGGVVLSQLSGMLIKALLEAIVQKGGAVLPAEITAELNRGLAMLGGLGDASIQVVGDVTTMVDGKVKEITSLGSGLLQDVGSIGLPGGDVREGLDKTKDNLGKEVDKLKDGIGGLLGGKKKDEKKDD
ncbi:MAG: hypothetical protein H6816_13240 [Phycisphaerales bacterium]|nr:hypothetical protein [Phycisphaerales bacterium]